MFRLLLGLIAFISFGLHAQTSWKETAPGGFSAEVSFSSNEIALDRPLEVNLTLEYPETHHPDLKSIQNNLLEHSAIKSPPFELIEAHESEISTENGLHRQLLKYKLQPQMVGTFPLTFYALQFIPNQSDQKATTIISDIADIKILPLTAPSLGQVPISPLLPFTDRLPIEMSAKNRTDLFNNPTREKNEELRNQEILKQAVSDRGLVGTS